MMPDNRQLYTRSDLADTELYREIEETCRRIRQPGQGMISDAADLDVSQDGRWAYFTGTIALELTGELPTRICAVDLASHEISTLTDGPGSDRQPRCSPDGVWLAFLSNRITGLGYQLYLMERASGTIRKAPIADGWIEYLQWSPDSSRLLLGVAGHGADVAGIQGGIPSRGEAAQKPEWMPRIEAGPELFHWRSLWMYTPATDTLERIPVDRINIWEAAWCGNSHAVVVHSPDPSEGSWYDSRLSRLHVADGILTEIYIPRDQITRPAASLGGRVAVVEAICSDRGNGVGDIRIFDSNGARFKVADLDGVNVVATRWNGEDNLDLIGVRGFETVIGSLHVPTGAFRELWSFTDESFPRLDFGVAHDGGALRYYLFTESFFHAPALGVVDQSGFRSLVTFDAGYNDFADGLAKVEKVAWEAPDGLEILGYLLSPGPSPRPTILYVHGGPVTSWRPWWLGRPRGIPVLKLLSAGYAVFFPNPRGSSGRGRDFASRVVGDMGGLDTQDLLAGLDHIIKIGRADPARLGVMGISYGGYMTAWLVTQVNRFAAAISVSPVINHVTQHLLSNIGRFSSLFLDESFDNLGGRYYTRSPLMHVASVQTPVLNICGLQDRCTPATEAVQFHRALVEAGRESVLITYPEEGHGVSRFPASIDYAARVYSWFEGKC